MTGPIGEVTNLVTLLAGATFGATRLWKVVKKSPHTFPRVGSLLGCRTQRFLLRSLPWRSWLQDCRK